MTVHLKSNVFLPPLSLYLCNDSVNNIDKYGYKAIDITRKLTKTMLVNASFLYYFARLHRCFGFAGKLAILNKFYKLVKTGGKWDFKNQKSWKLSNKDYYTFYGYKLSVADVENIHFGFVDSVLFSSLTLCVGAGIYQAYSGTSKWKYWYTFFDDPRNTYCILIGRTYWRLLYNRRVFQW